MELNKIYEGDSCCLIDELDKTPNLIIMSPPDIAETNYTLDQYKGFLRDIYIKCSEKLDENGVMVSITTDRKMKGRIYTKHIDIINYTPLNLINYKIWAKSLKANLYILNFSHILCFSKSKKKTNNKFKEWYPDVLLIQRDNIKGYKNKDSFPTKLIEIIVGNYSNSGDLILDPFMGTGKTGFVCKNLNRNYIGFELNSDNITIAENLIENNLI